MNTDGYIDYSESYSKEDFDANNQYKIELFKLKGEKKDIIKNIQSKIDELVKKAPNNSTDEQIIERISLGSVADFDKYEKSGSFVSSLELIQTKQKLRKERDKSEEKISEIEDKMKIIRIDLILEKISEINSLLGE